MLTIAELPVRGQLRISMSPDHALVQRMAATRTLLEREVRMRPDVYGWELVAWARYLDGDLSGAAEAITRAQRLGSLSGRAARSPCADRCLARP